VQSADHAPVEGQQAASAIGIAALLLAPPIGVTVAGYDLASSVVGTQLPRTCATARPQLAKADTAFQAHPLVNRLNLA